MELPAFDNPPRPRRQRHSHRRKRWQLVATLSAGAALVLAVSVIGVVWGASLKARFQSRLDQTLRDVPHETASVALPPLCFLLALVIACVLGVVVYKLGRSAGFALAGVNTAAVFLMWVWAMSDTGVPLRSIELQQVQLREVLYVLSFFTVVLIPLISYFAWYRASLK